MQRTTAIPDLRGLLLLVALVSAWLAGILLDQVLLLPSFVLLAGAGVALVPVVVCWHRARGRLIALVLLCLLLGAWRYASATRHWEGSCKLPDSGYGFTTRHIRMRAWAIGRRTNAQDHSLPIGEDLTYQGIECQGQLASMLRPLEGVSDF